MRALDASRQYKTGDCSWNDYTDQLLASAARDSSGSEKAELQKEDPFAFSVHSWMSNQPPTDINPLKAILTAYRREAPDKFRARYAELEKQPGYGAALTQSLALIALHDRRVDVLKLCLADKEVWKSDVFRLEAERADRSRSSEVSKVLEESRSSVAGGSASVAKDNGQSSRTAADRIRRAAMFDEGGEYPVKW